MKHFTEDKIYNVLNGDGFSISQNHGSINIDTDYHNTELPIKEAIEMFQEAIDWLKLKGE